MSSSRKIRSSDLGPELAPDPGLAPALDLDPGLGLDSALLLRVDFFFPACAAALLHASSSFPALTRVIQICGFVLTRDKLKNKIIPTNIPIT